MRTPLTFRKILPLCMAFFCLIVTVPLRGETAEKTRVILDSDMVEMFDDGVAMLMLLQSPKIELMGVTIVTGNTWAEAGTANAIRQLEGLGRDDIPSLSAQPPCASKNGSSKSKTNTAVSGAATMLTTLEPLTFRSRPVGRRPIARAFPPNRPYRLSKRTLLTLSQLPDRKSVV